MYNYKLKKLKKERKVNKPKISIISPNYNRGKYLLKFLANIQQQNFKELEIILIDDYSKDNSVKLIQKYKKIDKRIKLIINIINKGTFVCRNLGAIFSKGKYLVLQDPDDLLSKNIINLCYKYAEKFNYEMIRFDVYFGEKKISLSHRINNFENRPIYQPELSTYIFYGNKNELMKIDIYINNKFLRREVYIKALNFLKKYYLNMYITCYEDQILIYFLYKTSKSFFHLNKLGYYHKINSISISINLNKINNLRIKFVFIYIRLVFEYSKNNKYEKDMVNALFAQYIRKSVLVKISYIFKDDIKFFKDSIKIFLNSPFISKENKYSLRNFNNIIKKLIFKNK